MKRVVMLLIVLIISLVISGCCEFCHQTPPEPEVRIKTVYVYNPCSVPDVPNYLKMDDKSHLGSAYNINILIGNAQKMKTYNDGLLSSISCYEKQTKDYKKTIGEDK